LRVAGGVCCLIDIEQRITLDRVRHNARKILQVDLTQRVLFGGLTDGTEMGLVEVGEASRDGLIWANSPRMAWTMLIRLANTALHLVSVMAHRNPFGFVRAVCGQP
jgi:hypothetical protein